MGLSNSQFNSIMRDYERLQADNRADLDKRIDEVYQSIPEMRELSESVSSLATNRYRQYLRNKKAYELLDLSKEIEEIKNKKERLLKEHGFPKDYMQMRYTCDDCKDTGYIDGEKCHCFKSKIVDLFFRDSNISNVLQNQNFSKLDLNLYDNERIITNVGCTAYEYMKKVLLMCNTYVEDFDNKKGNIIFMGNTGVGKTFLTNCIAKEIIDKYYSVLYFTATELFDKLSVAKMDKEAPAQIKELAEYIYQCDLLIIDDLGVELTNSFTISQFFSIVNNRILADKATIISTNLSLNMLRDKYTERISSRIMSSYDIITLYGDDIRLKI